MTNKALEYQDECNKWFYVQLDIKIKDLMLLCKRKKVEDDILSLLNNMHEKILKHEKEKGWL